MASPVAAEDQSNTKTTEDGTTTFHKKRSRRVSFAENTSVHIFHRDDEEELYNKPPSSPYEELGFSEPDGEAKQFFRNEEEEEDDDEDDMDELGPRSPFLRVVRSSPSSGGSIIGSVTSNDDEDNFFGPVSTSFIRRDFSDSAASDENHDHTMDSTAFSMHFHSIARSDSLGDLKTSTGVHHLSFDEKTPTLSSIPSNTRNSMQLTLAKKPNSQPDVSTSKLSTGSQSNDMSLVGEYHAKYDYGRLSPALGALLAEGHNVSHVISRISVPKSPIKSGEQFLANKENGSESDLMDFSYGQDIKMQGGTNHEALNEVVYVKHNEMGVADDRSELFPSNQIAFGVSSNETEKENKSPLVGSITPLTDMPSHMLSIGGSLSKFSGTVTPSHNQASLFPRTESLKRGGSVSSLRKSISKLRILETSSPFSDVLNAKLEDSSSRSLVGFSKMTPLLEKNNEPLQANCMKNAGIKTLDTYFEEPLLSSGQKTREGESRFTNDNKTEIPKNLVPRTHKESFVEVVSLSVLPSGNTYMQPKLLQSAEYGYKDDENKIGDEKQSIQLNGSARFGLDNVGGLGESITIVQVSATASDGMDIQPSGVNQLSTGDLSSAERKRKTEDVTMAEKIARIKRSSSSDVEHPSGSEISSIGPNLKHLAEIHSRFFKEAKLFPNSVDKMNFHTIDRLVDILGQLQRWKTYQLLSNEIKSQIILDQGSNIQDKRVAETKYLLCKTVHEQAKLQLMHLKREKLLKSVRSLASGVHESEGLKLKYSPPNSLNVLRVIHHQPFPNNIEDIQECQVDCDKVTSMRQAVEDIDRRVSNLTNSFHKSCKMKGEPNPVDTIAFVKDHLMKGACCQAIRKDLQLWVLDDLKSSKDRHDIVLNYLDLMTQRLTITAGVIPGISISNILNEININKNFKDMDASTAFGYVFDAGLTQRHVGATSLAQETQVTSSLLGNLVDVMEEIQLARIELKNLVHARFHTSSGRCLDLELYFFDPMTRKKATVTLNTSCLKRGIYPSEIVPCKIFTPVNESQNSSSQSSLSTEIAAALKDLKVGFLKILRVCRCISQLVSLSR